MKRLPRDPMTQYAWQQFATDAVLRQPQVGWIVLLIIVLLIVAPALTVMVLTGVQ